MYKISYFCAALFNVVYITKIITEEDLKRKVNMRNVLAS